MVGGAGRAISLSVRSMHIELGGADRDCRLIEEDAEEGEGYLWLLALEAVAARVAARVSGRPSTSPEVSLGSADRCSCSHILGGISSPATISPSTSCAYSSILTEHSSGVAWFAPAGPIVTFSLKDTKYEVTFATPEITK